MTQYFGDFSEDETLYIPFNTFDSNDPSASVTITNLADADIKVHKDGSATQIVTDGATVVIDFDSITGNHIITIDTSAHSDYSTGSDYQVRIEGTTVDGATINAWVGSFSIENRHSAGALRPTTAGRTIDVTATGAAGIDWGNVENPTTAVDLSSTDIQLADTITNYTGNTKQTADNNVLASGATGFAAIDTVVDAIKVITDQFAFTVANLVDSNTLAVSGDTTAADNLEAQYDGTGIAGDTYPATQAQLSGIANVGSAVHKAASSYTLTTGTQSLNLYTDTEALDGTRHEHTDTAGVMLLEYHYLIGSGTPASFQFTGHVSGNNDDIDVFGYDWVTAGYKQIGNIQGSAATVNQVHSFDLFVDMVGSAGDLGKVDIKLGKTSGLTTCTLSVDQAFVAFNQGASGYDNGAVWLDGSASNTNTTVSIDGVATNPVSTIAAANTLLASTNLHRIHVSPATSITFAATQDNEIFEGHEWTLALGGQNIAASMFIDAGVSGTGTGAESEWDTCIFAITSLQAMQAYDCSFTATTSGGFTMSAAGDYRFINCQSGVAGSGSPLFTLGTGAITAEFRRWSGGITVSGISSDDILTIGGELGTITLNGADGTVEIRGTYKAIVDNRTGSPTLNMDGAIKGVDVASILVDTAEIGAAGAGLTAAADIVWDEVLTGGTHNVTNSAGKRLRAISGNIFTDGTAQSGGNNSIQLASGDVTTNDQYVRSKVIITAGTGVGQEAIITDSVASTDTLTTTPTWLTNPDATSEYQIVPAQVHTTVRNGGYDNGYVYVDVVNGSAGTIKGVNGTSTNKSSVIADARTIADVENIRKFKIEGGGAWSLDQSYTDWVFDHTSASLITLNSQDISGSVFMRSGVTGTGSSSATGVFELCGMLNTTVGVCNFLQCGFAGTITLANTAQYLSWQCFENGTAMPILDVNGDGITPTIIQVLGYTGRLELKGMTAGDEVILSGDAQVTLNVDCTGGTLTHSGDVKLTDNSGSVTIVQGNVSDILVDTTSIKSVTDTHVSGAAATGTLSTTVMTTDLSEVTDDHYIGRLVTFTSGVLTGQQTDITDYSGTNGTVTMTALTEAPSNSDTFIIT